ncbi:Cyclin-dependent kinase 11B [Thelohanellus kitauei]|uniref:cyclin-dependent kinase n=1 Tax=Thelohanellus kitauei TaxID=669202 RepID=A0A0C2MP20_THEKT|nr:Cyclin-dependent kinase 11B [Thelohanellus kitauei]
MSISTHEDLETRNGGGKKRKIGAEDAESKISSGEITSSCSKEVKSKGVYYPSYMGCRSVNNFETMNRIEEGMYGVVFRARDLHTGQCVALKKLKMEREREGFPITSLREINCLLKCRHENIVHVKEVVVGDNMNKIFIVMEYIEHDLKSLMESMRKPFSLDQTKTLLMQLLKGVAHLHDNWIIHRDIKTSNLLLNHRGILKIADFGLAREYGSPLAPYTPVVVTLWYRSPELLLGIKEYSYPVDIWSVGCVFAELVIWKALFRGSSEADQIKNIFQVAIRKKCRNSVPPPIKYGLGHQLFRSYPFPKTLLTYDPNQRISASDALNHDFFTEPPLPCPPSLFPTWPTKHEREARHNRDNASPQAPQGGKNFEDPTEDEEFFQRKINESANNMGFTMSATGRGFVQTIPNSLHNR